MVGLFVLRLITQVGQDKAGVFQGGEVQVACFPLGAHHLERVLLISLCSVQGGGIIPSLAIMIITLAAMWSKYQLSFVEIICIFLSITLQALAIGLLLSNSHIDGGY